MRAHELEFAPENISNPLEKDEGVLIPLKMTKGFPKVSIPLSETAPKSMQSVKNIALTTMKSNAAR